MEELGEDGGELSDLDLGGDDDDDEDNGDA